MNNEITTTSTSQLLISNIDLNCTHPNDVKGRASINVPHPDGGVGRGGDANVLSGMVNNVRDFLRMPFKSGYDLFRLFVEDNRHFVRTTCVWRGEQGIWSLQRWISLSQLLNYLLCIDCDISDEEMCFKSHFGLQTKDG